VRDIAPHNKAVYLRFGEGVLLPAAKVIVAAGAWSGILARRLGDPVLLESERGYNSTIPDPGVVVERQLIFGERKFVATPLECGLRIGGAAEFGGLNAKPTSSAPTLYALSGEWNALAPTTATGEAVTVRGRGAGRWPTSEAVMPDVLTIFRRRFDRNPRSKCA
jgi:glycine/D-amino acid oxidase-like deaminating enzyme